MTGAYGSHRDTRRSVELFEENGVPVLGPVVNVDRFTCECGREHDLFPSGSPENALDEFAVERRGPDEWALVARHP